MRYSMPLRVRYSETNGKGFVDLHKVLDYFQDSSIFHSESLGYGVKEELSKNRGWFLLAWDVTVERFPSMGEYITIVTEPYRMRGFYGYRRYMMKDEKEQILASADSLWLLMDLEKMMPLKVPDEMTQAYISNVEDNKIRIKRKLPENGEWETRDVIEVNTHFLDSNGHVNNANYAMWAETLLPDDFAIHKVLIDYRQSAFGGDKIQIDMIRENDQFRYRFTNQDQVLLALVTFQENK